MDQLDVLADRLDQPRPDPQARMCYDLLDGGLVWSDEVPAWSFDRLAPTELPSGQGYFRALLNYRSSLIVGQPREKFQACGDVPLSCARIGQVLCPNVKIRRWQRRFERGKKQVGSPGKTWIRGSNNKGRLEAIKPLPELNQFPRTRSRVLSKGRA